MYGLLPPIQYLICMTLFFIFYDNEIIYFLTICSFAFFEYSLCLSLSLLLGDSRAGSASLALHVLILFAPLTISIFIASRIHRFLICAVFSLLALTLDENFWFLKGNEGLVVMPGSAVCSCVLIIVETIGRVEFRCDGIISIFTFNGFGPERQQSLFHSFVPERQQSVL